MSFKLSLKELFCAASLLSMVSATAQDAAPVKPVGYTSGTPVNYVRSWDMVKPETSSDNINNATAGQSTRMSTQYLDGLGRPLQTVIKGGSLITGGSPVDMVAPVVYDEFGREVRKYLPYAATGATGGFRLNPFDDQATFYNGATSPIAGQGETFFYSKTEFEPSPLNRPDRSYAPGNSWVSSGLNGNADRGIKQKYWINTANDFVKKFTVSEIHSSNDKYNVTVKIKNRTSSDLTVEYSWAQLPSTTGYVQKLYRKLPNGIWQNFTSGTYSPATIVIPMGDYEFGITVGYNNGTPNETIICNQNRLGDYSSVGDFPAGSLYKYVSEDEKGMQTIEFKDKENKTILKKVQLFSEINGVSVKDIGLGTGYNGWLSTYYIYDEQSQLRLVLQPKAVEELNQNDSWSSLNSNSTILNELAFRYEYDEKGRIIIKKIPGSTSIYMVYDKRDRLVLSQDGNLRTQGKWLFTKYDALNRAIITGFYANSTSSQKAMQDYVNSQNLGLYENYDPKSFPIYSLNNSFPVLSDLNDVITITYYDDYEWGDWYGPYKTKDNTFDNLFLSPSNTVYPYPQSQVQSAATKGMVTGIWEKDGGYITANYYDDKGRIIQTKHINQTAYLSNFSSGIDITTMQYSFSGQLLRSVVRHQKAGPNPQEYLIHTNNTYDDLGRIVKVEKKIGTGDWWVLSEMQYDALGQLKTKKVGRQLDQNKNQTTTPLETLAYDYNIRGWMLGTNKDYVKGSSNAKFGFELAYDKSNAVISGNTYIPQYNGNIAGTIWKSAGDGKERRYDFTYDNANRLAVADFNQYDGGYFNKNAGIDFTVNNMGYDANGNITSMHQKGWKGTESDLIDQLTYNYYPNSNRLQNVIDAKQDKTTRLGDFRYSSLYEQSVSQSKASSAVDYSYDANGNLIKDLNKDIEGSGGASGIEYNYLNLPQKIWVKKDNANSKGYITYTYDAGGNKLKKETIEYGVVVPNQGTQTVTTTTNYIAGFVYESKSYSPLYPGQQNYTDRLQFFGHEEGRVRYKPETGAFVYDYFLKDHLDNVRMVLTEEKQTAYYPAATLEGTTGLNDKSMVNWEKQFYSIDNTQIRTRSQISSWTASNDYQNNNGNPPHNSVQSGSYPSDYTVNDGATSDKLYKVNATTNKTGLAIAIKVMAGDYIDIFGKSYYHSNASNYDNTNSTKLIVTELLNAFLSTPAAVSSEKAISAAQMESINVGKIPASFIRGENGSSSATPKAYINYMLFDEQFVYDKGDFSKVGQSDVVKDHGMGEAMLKNIEVKKNGYLYVYVSNESNLDVFFDNLQVVHTKGPILEETHYYPFGLSMSGISSKAANFGGNTPDCGCGNKKLFNGNEIQNKEFSDGSGLELYDFNARTYDQQIGRFIQIDPTPEDGDQESLTPYHFSGNNPSTFNDPNGKCPWCWGAVIGAAVEYGTQVAGNLASGRSLGESLTKVNGGAIIIAAGAGALSVGASAFVPKGVAGKIVKEAVVTAIDAGESAAKQYMEPGGNVSLTKTVTDVVANKVGGKITENIKVNSSSAIKATEKQLDRVKRIATNDATSSGRAAAVKKLDSKVSSMNAANKRVQQAASGATSNTLQVGANAVVKSVTNNKKVALPTNASNKQAADNTAVKKPIPHIY